MSETFINTRAPISEGGLSERGALRALIVGGDSGLVTFRDDGAFTAKSQLGYSIDSSVLKNLIIPKAILNSGSGAFGYIEKVAYDQPSASSATTFQNRTTLKALDIRTWSSVHIYFTSGCTMLNVFVLRDTTKVLPLSGTGAFTNTPFASSGSGGTLYVPSALISSYQSATNWSTILGYANNTITAIEGSPYEHYYVDGTPLLTS